MGERAPSLDGVKLQDWAGLEDCLLLGDGSPVTQETLLPSALLWSQRALSGTDPRSPQVSSVPPGEASSDTEQLLVRWSERPWLGLLHSETAGGETAPG